MRRLTTFLFALFLLVTLLPLEAYAAVGDTIVLGPGEHAVGQDIPVGEYLITKKPDSSGVSYIYKPRPEGNLGISAYELRTFLVGNETYQDVLREGDVISISSGEYVFTLSKELPAESPTPTPALSPNPTPSQVPEAGTSPLPSSQAETQPTETKDVINHELIEKLLTSAVNPLPVEGTDKIVVSNWALIEGKFHPQLVVEFTNVSTEIIPDFEAQIIFYDADGNILETEKDGHDAVLPGTTVVTQSSILDTKVMDYDSIEVIVDPDIRTNQFINHVENVEIKGNVSGNKVFLQVINNDSVEIDEIEIVVVSYDENNNIIGATEKECRNLASGKKEILEFNGYDPVRTAKCIYYINQAHTFLGNTKGKTDASKMEYINSGIIELPAELTEPTTKKEDIEQSNDAELNASEDKPGTENLEGYGKIYDEYALKLKEATPGLIEEYKTEAAKNTSGLEGLAEISMEKVEKLAEISMEGVEKMAEYALSHGSGKYSEYEEWATKLNEVYMEEAEKITEAYTHSAMGAFGF